MPVLRKEIELEDGTKIWVRQASGSEKLPIEVIQAKAIRKCRHFGDPTEWTEEQNEEFLEVIDELGGGIQHQIESWIPPCILSETVKYEDLTSIELRTILSFVRGDSGDGAIPLERSQE